MSVYSLGHYKHFFPLLMIAAIFFNLQILILLILVDLKSIGVRVVPHCLLTLTPSGVIQPQWRLNL